MSTEIYARVDFPEAPFYVLANDTFLSGLGPAKGKINTVVLPCESLKEAEIVEQNAKNRSDMKYIRIVGSAPRMKHHVLYSLMDREDAARWYEKVGF